MPNGNQEAPQKEERFDVAFKGPISSLPGIVGFFGGEEDEEEGGGVKPQLTGPQEESQFSQEDIDEYVRQNGPPPPGVELPKPTVATPTGQEGAPGAPAPGAPEPEAPAPGQEGRLPTRLEAYEEARQPLPSITTREEFREKKGIEAPPWWKKMLRDFALGGPGKSMEEFETKAEEAYQKFIEPEARERAEQVRQAGVTERFAGPRQRDVGKMIGMKEGEFLVPESQMGSYAGVIGAYNKAQNAEPVNFSTIIPGAPDIDIPPEMAKAMVPLITQMMRAGKVTSWAQFAKDHPKEYKEIKDYESSLKESEAEKKASKEKQGAPDLFAEKRSLVDDPAQLGEYLGRIGEEAPAAGFDISLDEEGEVPADIGPFADNYLWQRNKINPKYKEWSDNFLKNEGLAFRRPPTSREVQAHAAENEMTKDEARVAMGPGEIKRYKGTYRAINGAMRRDKIPQGTVDKFLGYHFPDEHEKDLVKRGESQEYIDSVTKITQRDVTPGGGVIQGFGAKADRAAVQAYADAKGITYDEALEDFRQDPNTRLVGLGE